MQKSNNNNTKDKDVHYFKYVLENTKNAGEKL